MKKIVFLYFFIGFSAIAYSQSNKGSYNKESIVIMEAVKDGFETDESKRITQELKRVFRETDRFSLVDKYVIEKETERGTRAYFTGIDNETIERARKNNIKYLVSSVISTYQNDGRRCDLVLSIKVMDVDAANYMVSKEISAQTGKKSGIINIGEYNTRVLPKSKQDLLFKKALEDVSKEIQEFIKKDLIILM